MEKVQKFRFNQKKLLNHSKIIIFSLKIFPFIIKEKKNLYIKEIYDYALTIDKNYACFVDYFKKNWEGSEFLDFDVLPNGYISKRTNNIIETFHHKLNNAIRCRHPRISILVEKLSQFSIEYYHKYVDKLFKENNAELKQQNIFNDIYNYLKKFLA